MTTFARLPLAALGLGMLLSASSRAQQQLYLLDAAGQVFEVTGYQTASGALTPVASVPLPAGTVALDLAADPLTGDLFVLTGTINTATLERLELATGQLSPLCTFGLQLVDGLDARSDGVLVSETGLDTLLLIDPTTCTTTLVATQSPIGQHTSSGSLAVDGRGLVVALAADSTNQRIDPLDGASLPFSLPVFGGTYALEVDTNGDVFYGQFDGALFRSAALTQQLWQVLPSTGAATAIRGLAFTLSADGDGMTLACAASPNSTGVPSTIEAVGTAVAQQNDLELRCRDLPLASFGYFLVGPSAGSMPVGQGVLCIGVPQFRYSLFVQNSGQTGTVRFAPDLTSLPSGASVQPGDTYLFQYWHRDAGSTSNLSPALEVLFR